MHVVVYSAPDCCLCHEALQELESLTEDLAFTVSVVDISGDLALEARYRERIPVGEIDGRVAFKYRVDRVRLRRLLGEGRSA